MNKAPVLRDWLVMLVLALVWGCSFLFIKKVVAVYTPVQAAFWRVSVSTLFYIPIAIKYWSKIDWKKWRPLIAVALAGSAVPSLLFAVAQQKVESSVAGILNSLTPLFTMLIGVIVYRLNTSRSKIIGVSLGLVGAFVLIFLDPDAQSTDGSTHYAYAFLCVLAAVCYSISANTITNYLREMHPAAIGAGAFLIMSPLFFCGLVLSGGVEQMFQHPQGFEAIKYVIYLSGVGTVLASILYFDLIQKTSAVFATSVTYLLPIVSIFFGFMDGETVHLTDFLGTAIILAGLYLSRQ
jgi:drug/metabolite transporter (DMT)-like permease